MDNNKRFWQRVAKMYTRMHERGNAALYRELVARAAKYIHEDTSVLELAAGTGQMTYPLADLSDKWIATDFAENMVSEGARNNATKATFEVQDATNITYEDDTFDVVVIANALHIMPDPDRALSEIRRVLKRDGIVIAPTFIYEGKRNKVKLWLMERVGFKTFTKWTSSTMDEYVRSRGYDIIERDIMPAKPTSEYYLVLKNNK